MELTHVASAGAIGSLQLKNRLVRMGAQGWLINWHFDGDIAPEVYDYYESLAEGGFAAVTVAGAHIGLEPTPDDAPHMSFDTDRDFAVLQKLARLIHAHDAHALVQFASPYPALDYGNPDVLSLSSSTLSQEDLDEILPCYIPPRAITVDEIDRLVERYAESAERMQRAGFDGVEVNSAHVHFLNTFISKIWNRRDDEYGGGPEGRSRLLCRIVGAIKERCGADFAVITMISGGELGIQSNTLDDVVAIAKCLEAAGSDCIHVRFEVYDPEVNDERGFWARRAYEVPDVALWPKYAERDLSEYGIDNSFGNGRAAYAGAAAAIKQAVNIPVMLVGRMDAEVADQLIAEGKIDFANICRRGIADPQYVNKMLGGHADDVRPCVGCFTCYDMAERGLANWCMVNGGFLGGRSCREIERAPRKKRVLVVGAGAAGLEAARVAALRGHDVTIVDEADALGGVLPVAALIKDFHEDFLGFSQWQVRQVKKLGVNVVLKTRVDRAFVKEFAPDALIVAVGGKDVIPDIPGLNKRIVTTGEELHDKLKLVTKVFNVKTLGKLTKAYLPVGKNVVIIGGGIHGVQTAEFLVRRGRKVTIVTEDDEFGTGMLDCGPKLGALEWLKDNGTQFFRNMRYREVTKAGLVVEDELGREFTLACDSIITALPMQPNLALLDQVKDLAPEVFAVGDCNPLEIDEPYPVMVTLALSSRPMWPHFTATAVREAFRIAKDL